MLSPEKSSRYTLYKQSASESPDLLSETGSNLLTFSESPQEPDDYLHHFFREGFRLIGNGVNGDLRTSEPKCSCTIFKAFGQLGFLFAGTICRSFAFSSRNDSNAVMRLHSRRVSSSMILFSQVRFFQIQVCVSPGRTYEQDKKRYNVTMPKPAAFTAS
jgi:hypothetical protein